ncbi:hypothetical protein DPMN_132194 [Dreissena polymorpha]|uniref:EF-hand domain-containing protein n=1 Tax=Dreissena polymorpha TaxID=45954 RepID=A0A9D4FSW0_DREPO|nr:hypothetical protein DPMN_132194 [Dreissena polymorpha]
MVLFLKFTKVIIQSKCACFRVNLLNHWTLQEEPLRFKVKLLVNPCTFMIYDANKDGMITRDELEAIFGDEDTTGELAQALDKNGELILFMIQPHTCLAL